MDNLKVHESERMAVEAPLKLILRFALPAILTMIISSIYNTVDRIFVGQGIGYLGISATTVSASIMYLISGLTTLFGTGGAVFLALELGENHRENAENIVGNAVIMQIAVAVTAMVLGLLFAEPLCRLAGAGEDALPYTVDYMRIILLGCLPQCLGTGMAALMRSEGRPKQAMLFVTVGSVLNCALDPLFIFVFRWGIRGAAAATVVSECVSAILVLRFFVRSRKSEVRLTRKGLHPKRALIRRMFTLGLPSFLTTLVLSVMILLLTHQLQRYGSLSGIGGDVAVSALGVSVSIGNIITMIGAGTQQGVAPLIGYNYGAGLYSRVCRIYRTSLYALLAVLAVFWVIIEAVPLPLIHLFGDTPNEDFAVFTTRIYNLALPLLAFQTLGVMYLQSTGQAKLATLTSLARNACIGIPLLFILPPLFGVYGIIWQAPIADAGGALLSGLLVRKGIKKISALPDRPYETERA